MSHTPWRRALLPVAAAALLAGTLVYAVVRSGSATDGPTFYGDIDYGGSAVTLGVGNYDLPRLRAAGKVNDNISSIRVPVGYTVAAFQHSGFAGRQWTFTADNPNMLNAGINDAISSMRIIQN